MATRQHIFGRSGNTDQSPTYYANPFGGCDGSGWSETEPDVQQLIAAAGQLQNLYVQLTAASSGSCTFTVMKNGVATDVALTIPAGETSGSAPICVAVAVDDEVTVREEKAGGAPTTHQPIWVLEYISSEGDGIAIYGVTAPASGSSTNRAGVFGDKDWLTSSVATQVSIVTTAGNLIRARYKVKGTLNSGESFLFAVYLDGAIQDGSGGTPDTRVTIDDTTPGGLDGWSGTLACTPGQTLQVRATPTGSPSDQDICAGFAFQSTVDGEWNMAGYVNDFHVGYQHLTTPSDSVWSTPESNFHLYVGLNSIRFSKLRIKTTDQVTADFAVRRNAADTLLIASLVNALSGSDLTNEALLTTGDRFALAAAGTDEGFNTRSAWGVTGHDVSTDPSECGAPPEVVAGNGLIGPLIWLVLSRVRQPSGDTSADAYSDIEMQCPASYYGGYKAPFLQHAGDAERALSDPISGDVVSSTFDCTLADQNAEEEGAGSPARDSDVGRLRAQLASSEDRYWTLPAWFMCTTRANRAALGAPFTAFAGNVIDVQTPTPRQVAITLGDLLTERIVNDKLQVPWRLIRDGFLTDLDHLSEKLDLEQPEPIIYGDHSRSATGVLEASPGASPSSDGRAFRIVPIYLGIETVGAAQKHVWLVAGHACKSVRIFIDDVEQEEADGWLIPGQAGFAAAFGAKYVDRPSSTFGTTRRYTLIYGNFGNSSPWWQSRQSGADFCAIGDRTLTAAVEGIETDGDGDGELITDLYDIYKHFTVNFLANAGPDSYHSGAWLSSPQWSNPNGAIVDVVKESSFDDVKEIAAERLGGSPASLLGAVAIGVRAGHRASPSAWIAEFNRNGFCQSGPVEPFQWGITTLHPTQAAKDAAPQYLDAYEILEGSFSTVFEWFRHATHFPWRTDYVHETGVWSGSGVVPSDEADNYPRKDAPTREYAFVAGTEFGEHLATLAARLLANPPRLIGLDAPIGPDPDGDSLAYRNLGDYLTYEHFDAVTEERELRLAYVQRVGVRGSARRSYVVALDVEDLINFDVGGSPGGSP